MKENEKKINAKTEEQRKQCEILKRKFAEEVRKTRRQRNKRKKKHDGKQFVHFFFFLRNEKENQSEKRTGMK